MHSSALELKKNFQFVDTSDSKSLFTVRSHVSKQSWQEWRSSRHVSKDNPPAPNPKLVPKELLKPRPAVSGKNASVHRRKKQLKSGCSVKEKISTPEPTHGDDSSAEESPTSSSDSFWIQTALATLDPFGLCPISLGPPEQRLIHHCECIHPVLLVQLSLEIFVLAHVIRQGNEQYSFRRRR